ncbi:MAG: hypothetical protein U9R51_07980, partial [Actinomycetota bacterium]|nr:hypothetical protein [Actinomycetota bacterium]
MSSQLDDRIRTMMQTVVDESPPPPEIPVRPPAPVAPRQIPNWAVAVSAAVAVLVLIGGVTLLLDGSSTDDVVEEPPPTVATTTPMTIPDATPTSVPEATPTSVPGTTIPAAPIPELSASGLLTTDFINEVRDLAMAPDGTVWVATRGGVVQWDVGGSVRAVYGEQDGLPTAGVERIVVATDGTVWAIGWGWIAYYDETWQPIEINTGELPGELTADTTDGVWAVGGEVLFYLDRDGAEQISIPAGDWNGYDGVAVDEAGRVWMVSGDGDHGVVVYDGGSWREFTIADGLPSHILSGIAVAPDGTVWIST